MARNVEESWPEHPLFPAEEDADPQRIEFIQVVRYEHGRALLVPTTFRSGELTSLDAINNMYGGGLYELIGRRCSVHDPTSMGRISAKVRYEIAGPSRPLVVDANAPPSSMPAVVTQVASAPSDGGVMGILTMMLQNSRDEARAARELQQQAQERARTESMQAQQNMMQMQTTMMSGMLGVVTALAGNKGGGGIDDISKMASLFKDLGVLSTKGGGEGGEDNESISGIISNVADIVAGAVELKGAGGIGPGIASPAPPGSAASVLGANPKQEPMFEVKK